MPRQSTLNRVVNSIAPLRRIKWSRATRRFCEKQAAQGITFQTREVPMELYKLKTLLIDSRLVMEGWNAVRMAAAPLAVCPIEKYRRQGSWMMLTAGVALGCNGYGPLENFAREMSFESSRMARQYPKISEIPYDDYRQIETTVHKDAGMLRAFSKGAPDAILQRCTRVLDGRERELTVQDRREALGAAADMERHGLETLAFATKQLEGKTDAPEQGMTFLGVVAMGDLPAEHMPFEMEKMRRLGKRPVFVAEAAYPENAVRASGVIRPDYHLMHGTEIAHLEAEELARAAVYADAFVGMDNALRRRMARALRHHGGVAIVAPMPDGEVAISLGRNGDDDATLRAGGLGSVIRLLDECQQFCAQFEDRLF